MAHPDHPERTAVLRQLLGDKRAVLLDALGTLVALRPPGPGLVSRLRETHGIELSQEAAGRAFAAEIAYYRAHHLEGRDDSSLEDLRRRCAEVLQAALPLEVAEAIALEELQEVMLVALSFTPYPEARATLGELRALGLRLVVVSNWDVSLRAVLQASGLLEMLDGVLSSAYVGAAKPAPEIFRAALALVGVSAEDALHVGDSPEQDVAGALAAGVAPVLLHREAVPDTPASGLDAPASSPAGISTISSLAELPAMLT